MATQPALTRGRAIGLELKASFARMRALAWDGDVLYASRGYSLLRARTSDGEINWERVARFRPRWWRNITGRHRLTFRLARDGFHALAKSGANLIAAVPGAIATLKPEENEFQISHRLVRGTRPLHIAPLPDGRVFWGEYFDNATRDEVHVYASSDSGLTWHIAFTFTFPSRSIRHIHNILYDKWADRLWIFTGDYAKECRVLSASTDWKSVDEVLCGNQQARAVAAVITKEGLYFASDSPLEENHIYFLNRRGGLRRLCAVPSSSIYACQNRNGMYFSTIIEPSEVTGQPCGTLRDRRWKRVADSGRMAQGLLVDEIVSVRKHLSSGWRECNQLAGQQARSPSRMPTSECFSGRPSPRALFMDQVPPPRTRSLRCYSRPSLSHYVDR